MGPYLVHGLHLVGILLGPPGPILRAHRKPLELDLGTTYIWANMPTRGLPKWPYIGYPIISSFTTSQKWLLSPMSLQVLYQPCKAL